MYERLQRIVKCAVVVALGIAATAACGSRMAAQVPAGFGTTPIFGTVRTSRKYSSESKGHLQQAR